MPQVFSLNVSPNNGRAEEGVYSGLQLATDSLIPSGSFTNQGEARIVLTQLATLPDKDFRGRICSLAF